MRPKPLSYAVSVALASLMAGHAAIAQEAPAPAPAQEAPAAKPAAAKPTGKVTVDDGDAIQVVHVNATRASQQSSIDRKKNAATAQDSIVAEDVGAFPDRNIGEAISRISGIALDRGDYGEGVSVAVRGNTAALTRVEIDGQGVQSAGGTDLNGGGGGRGVEFRAMSSDLIKSVDVVKGSTADMTEGSLGGGIIIKTRTGLDFKKPFYSLRLAASQGSINKIWSPDTNLILAKQFLDDRLGVLLNVSTSAVRNEAHSEQVATSASQGLARVIDFDNSPNKTFSFNPDTVSKSDPSATQTTLASPLLTGGGNFNASTPLELVTKSAQAKSKADCYASFPNLTTAQQNTIAVSSRVAAVNQRGNELLTCLNQWNDYTPSLIRNFVKSQIDRREDLDLRFDFKVNNELTVYAKVNYTRRVIDDNQQTYALGGLTVNPTVANSPSYFGPAYTTSAAGVISAVPGSGYYNYDNYTFRTNLFPAQGAVANVVPGSATVDANHHVTSFTISDGNANTDQIHNIIRTSSQYFQTGGTYRNGPLLAEFFVGDSKSDFSRGDKRTNFSINYGPTTISVLPNGLWSYSVPSTSAFDQTNPALYATVKPASVATVAVPLSPTNTRALPPYTIAQQPLVTQAPQITYSPQIKDTAEKTAKLDLTLALDERIPFLTRLKSGFNFRDTSGNSWGGGGYVAKSAIGTIGTPGYVAPIVVPTANIRGSFIGCTDTAGSLGAGGAPCANGFVSNSNPLNVLSGQTVMSQAAFQNIIGASMQQAANAQFFAGAKDRPANLINGWNQIDVEKVFNMVGSPNLNFDCVKQCMGSDGKMYQQQAATFSERSMAGYLMSDFEMDHIPFTNNPLPWGMEFGGNFGYRYVKTDVKATGSMGFTAITKTGSFDPANPNSAAGTVSSTFTQNTTFSQKSTDFLPIYNLALWVVPNQVVIRYNHAKTVARPPVSSLLPAGACTYDERKVGTNDSSGSTLDMSCGTTPIGNPALKAQMNINHNLSTEWYPNKDTMFSLGAFKQVGIVGPAVTVGKTGVKLFAGTDQVDPTTGVALKDVAFNYSTFENGPPSTRKGLEFATKSAFTFLPWYFRNLGVDLNYTKLRSATTTAVIRDLITGDVLPPVGESSYSYNASLWYDDGAFSARVAVQAVASVFNCIAACGANTVNNYPSEGGGRTTVLPYNPGSPNFRDATRYIDAKMAYKFKNNVEIFIEGRNLGKATTSNSQQGYSPYADGTANLLDYAYAGARVMIGVQLKSY